MTDAHIWNLAQRIDTQQNLLDLGLNALRIPEYKVETALTKKNDIQLAAHRILKNWCLRYGRREEAYDNLLTGLRECGLTRLAAELSRWVEGSQ